MIIATHAHTKDTRLHSNSLRGSEFEQQKEWVTDEVTMLCTVIFDVNKDVKFGRRQQIVCLRSLFCMDSHGAYAQLASILQTVASSLMWTHKDLMAAMLFNAFASGLEIQHMVQRKPPHDFSSTGSLLPIPKLLCERYALFAMHSHILRHVSTFFVCLHEHVHVGGTDR